MTGSVNSTIVIFIHKMSLEEIRRTLKRNVIELNILLTPHPYISLCPSEYYSRYAIRIISRSEQ